MIPSNREPTHPGEILLEEFLRPLNITQSLAAELLGISPNRLNEIINGKRGVSADTALRLARVFQTSPEFWLNLQAHWDLYKAKRELGATLDTLPEAATALRAAAEAVEDLCFSIASEWYAREVPLPPAEIRTASKDHAKGSGTKDKLVAAA